MKVDIEAKLKRWEQRLLDLGKRNPNLNFRFNKTSTLEIKEPEINLLWENLVDDEKVMSFGIYREKYWDNMDENTEDCNNENKFSKADLKTNQSPTIQIKILRNLKKRSKMFSEEQGINVLYLCFGFLNYNEGRNWYQAPLILVPVCLNCENVNAPYTLSLHEDEIIINPTLKHMLVHDYNLELPEFDPNTSNLEKYLDVVNQFVNNSGWNICAKVGLGLLYFAKISMYNDLKSKHDKILESGLINTIVGNPTSQEIQIPDCTNLDRNDMLKPVNNYQVVDADSSQQEAILYAKSGVNFVLQGPPGTGKSQTITNIIAEMLAAGKKVLFVSEKKAALDVVHKRLREAQLDDFCLIMHNGKASKQVVMEQFKHIIDISDRIVNIKSDAFESLDKLENDKLELNNYVQELHEKIMPLNRSIFDINAELSTLQDAANLKFSINNIKNISSVDFTTMLALVKRYIYCVNSMSGEISSNPWYGCNITELTHETSHDIDFYFNKLLNSINDAKKIFNSIKGELRFSTELTYLDICNTQQLFDVAKRSRYVPASWVLEDELSPLITEIEACSETKYKFNELRTRIIEIHNKLLQYDSTLNFNDYNILSNSTFITAHNQYVNKLLSQNTVYSLLNVGNANELIDEILDELEKNIATYNNLKNRISEKYENEIFSIDAMQILQRFKTEYTWGFMNFVKGQYRSDKKLFKGLLRKVNENIDDSEIINTLQSLKSFKEISDILDINESKYRQYLGENYTRETTNIQNIRKQVAIYRLLMNSLQEVNKLKIIVTEHENRENVLKRHYENLYSGIETDWGQVRNALDWAIEFKTKIYNIEQNKDFVKNICSGDKIVISKISNAYSEISSWKENWINIYNWIKNLFDDGNIFDSFEIDKLASRLQDCLETKSILQDWVDYRTVCKDCSQNELNEFVRIVEDENLPAEDIMDAFKKRFYELWLDQVLVDHKSVADFRGKLQNERIREFKNLDREQFTIAKARTRSKLINNLSNYHISTNNYGEVAILKKELNKKRRIMPIRKLFNEIPQLVMMLKPCLMMSPLTVSLFLQSDKFEFDVVIFDEASQVCTENAIGAIMRGKQVIIAGDSKQLPPTNFFQASVDNGSDEYDEDDETSNDVFESLLDEAALFPVKTLLWHYRSRHEHLIAFSNAKIYRSKLITFPSNKELGKDVGVQYEYVPTGFYDRGGRSGNIIEAERVADMVFEHFKKCAKGEFNRSLGVITFGEIQAQAIETALRMKREADSSLEEYFSEELENPFFIKSLENVQGDERDTIIFSIGYAKDSNGIMHMFFGPLSQSGGERRLNVAITRAKFNIKLVGSILPTDIDIDRITSEGPKLLRSYIDFAQRGVVALNTEVISNNVVTFDSPFEESVYNFLVSNGYDIRTQVGCSNYRIDLAVQHPKLSGCFVLGIECDGATYHSARTARERDRLRQDVLENMGWSIYRIWSTDWIKDPITEGRHLLDAVQKAIIEFSDVATYTKTDKSIDDVENIIDVKIIKSSSKNKYNFDEFPDLEIYKVQNNNLSLKERMKAIVKETTPISIDLLNKIFSGILGESRVTKYAREKVDCLLIELRSDISVVENFAYLQCCDKIKVRMAGPRAISQISVEELAEGILKVASSNLTLNREELLKETAEAFGFKRRGSNVITCLNSAFEFLAQSGKIKDMGSEVKIKKSRD